MSARRGRRAGGPDTRGAIVAAARNRFAEKGYAGTSLRAVAADAGVDPALVHHYFDGKQGLFIAALDVGFDPRDHNSHLADVPIEEAGQALVRVLLSVWDDPERRSTITAIALALAEPGVRRLISDVITRVVLAPLAPRLPEAERAQRLALVASQLTGLILVRYILEVEPLASQAPERLVADVGPNVQRYLTGEL